MIRRLELENFKAFGRRQVAPMAPITLIYGPNSGGKSSIIQALLMMKQLFAGSDEPPELWPDLWEREPAPAMPVRGPHVDLGSFESVVHGHVIGRRVSVRVDVEPVVHPVHGRESDDEKAVGVASLEVTFGADQAGRAADPKSEALKARVRKVSYGLPIEPPGRIEYTRTEPTAESQDDLVRYLIHAHMPGGGETLAQCRGIVEGILWPEHQYNVLGERHDDFLLALEERAERWLEQSEPVVERLDAAIERLMPWAARADAAIRAILPDRWPIWRRAPWESAAGSLQLGLMFLVALATHAEASGDSVPRECDRPAAVGAIRMLQRATTRARGERDVQLSRAKQESLAFRLLRSGSWELYGEDGDIVDLDRWSELVLKQLEFVGSPPAKALDGMLEALAAEAVLQPVAFVSEVIEQVVRRDLRRSVLSERVGRHTKAVRALVAQGLAGVSHLGPLRRPPQRMALVQPTEAVAVGREGEHALDLLLTSFDPQVRRDLTARAEDMLWIERFEELGDGFFREPIIAEIPLTDLPSVAKDPGVLPRKINESMKAIELPYTVHVSRLASTELGEVLVPSLRTADDGLLVSFTDVGVGVSQVLPLLVEAHVGCQHVVCVEQPEIHLHPRQQAALADVFIKTGPRERDQRLEMVDYGEMEDFENGFFPCESHWKQWIIETHSEALMLRIQRRIREGKLKAEDVSVLYVKPGADGARIHHLRLDEDGSFLDDWPDGFFEERFDDLFEV